MSYISIWSVKVIQMRYVYSVIALIHASYTIQYLYNVKVILNYLYRFCSFNHFWLFVSRQIRVGEPAEGP